MQLKSYTESMNTSEPRGIIFDFNGVIVDDYELQKQAYSEISVELRGTPITDNEMVQNIRGNPTKANIAWIADGSLSEEEIADYSKKKDLLTERLFATSPLFRLNNGLAEFFDEIKQSNIPCTIATSQTPEHFRPSFDKLGLERWFSFDNVLCYDGKHAGKPAPDPYILAAKKIGLEPPACIVFEDALSGIHSAQAAGVHSIVVVGKDEQLQAFSSLPKVSRGIHDFTEIDVSRLTTFPTTT